MSTNNKEPTEDNWDLDIENEIDFDEIEADETVESKQSAESKSDCGSTATGRYAATGEIKVALPAKETASKFNHQLLVVILIHIYKHV